MQLRAQWMTGASPQYAAAYSQYYRIRDLGLAGAALLSVPAEPGSYQSQNLYIFRSLETLLLQIGISGSGSSLS